MGWHSWWSFFFREDNINWNLQKKPSRFSFSLKEERIVQNGEETSIWGQQSSTNAILSFLYFNSMFSRHDASMKFYDHDGANHPCFIITGKTWTMVIIWLVKNMTLYGMLHFASRHRLHSWGETYSLCNAKGHKNIRVLIMPGWNRYGLKMLEKSGSATLKMSARREANRLVTINKQLQWAIDRRILATRTCFHRLMWSQKSRNWFRQIR